MERERKIKALNSLGDFFDAILDQKGVNDSNLMPFYQQGVDLIDTLKHKNAWFTPDSVKQAMKAWAIALQTESIEKWLAPYNFSAEQKKVGVIMAGNIPMVGLHDALCVLLSNHQLHAKLSSKDQDLMLLVLNVLKAIEPRWSDQIKVVDRLNDIDILIATGSDNSARYFDYYFKDKKRLIRKNRTSVAILNGNESKEELDGLADDVFTHFGLGCRNVTKVYLPQGYDKDHLFNAFYKYKELADHNAYANNYDYNKAVYLLNSIDLVENGFLLLKEDEALHSPLGVLFYEYYNDEEQLLNQLQEKSDEIQCVVSSMNQHVNFGEAQSPQLWDYADGVDTLNFLEK